MSKVEHGVEHALVHALVHAFYQGFRVRLEIPGAWTFRERKSRRGFGQARAEARGRAMFFRGPAWPRPRLVSFRQAGLRRPGAGPTGISLQAQPGWPPAGWPQSGRPSASHQSAGGNPPTLLVFWRKRHQKMYF